MAQSKRPGFVESWLTDLTDDVRQYGKHKLVPWRILLCMGFGAAISSLVASEFWTKLEVAVAFFAAIVTLNGLLLALSWSSFAKIYEVASRPSLASFLRRHGLLDSYVFQVDFIHLTQVVALAFAGLGLAASVIGTFPALVEAYAPQSIVKSLLLTLSIASSIYALINAVGAVKLLQDLVWYSAQLPTNDEGRDMTLVEGGKRDQPQ